uniref:Astacin domain-containing protein n=1 Tax=Strongyloides papillosus TaxID=174720 RepID=A0A0N5BC86_STREA
MKISFVFSLVSLYIMLCSAQEASEKNIQSASSPTKTPPYHKKSGEATYYYQNGMSSDILRRIFRQINRFTCLNFKEKKEGPVKEDIGINFEVTEKENEIKLSVDPQNPTTVYLKKDVYDNYKNLSFYIGQALNIIPEVGRHDRDSDVTVNSSHIKPEFEKYYKQTKKDDITYLKDTEFDFGSPMFFNPYFGSVGNGKQTYTVNLYKAYQPSFGNGKVFRHNDYKHMFYYYCDSVSTTINCEYGGYHPPTSEFQKKCKCPEYLTGEKCTDFVPNTSTQCPSQQNLVAEEKKSNLEITGISGSCHYKIKSKNNGKKVKVTVEKLEYENSQCENSNLYLEVLVREDKGAKGVYLCKNSSSVELPALSSEVFVVFNGNSKYNYLNISYEEVNDDKSKNL